jgi:hypothetical protein
VQGSRSAKEFFENFRENRGGASEIAQEWCCGKTVYGV